MKEIKTKESLISEIGKLEVQLKERVDYGERVRKEFAKAFNWYKAGGLYGNGDRESIIPSWEMIFVELGKLLSARNFTDLKGNISELEVKLEDLERRLLKNVNPNL